MKKRGIAIIALCIAGCTALACSVTPNALLRQIAPKQYVLNAYRHSRALLERQLGRKESQTPFSLTVDFKREGQEMVQAGIEADQKRVNFFSVPLLGQTRLSVSKGTLELQKYFALPHVYKKCCSVHKKISKKILLSDDKLWQADVFEITFDREAGAKLLELVQKTALGDIPEEQSRQWKQLFENVREQILEVTVDRRGKIRGIQAEFSAWETPVYAELLLEDAAAYANRLEARVFTRGQSNMTWSLKSVGNHCIKEDSINDVTQISVLKSYVQLAQLSFKTQAQPSGGQVTTAVSGNILGHELNIAGTGDYFSEEETQRLAETFSVALDMPQEVKTVQKITGVSEKRAAPWLNLSGTYQLTVEKRTIDAAKEESVNIFTYLKENPDFLTGWVKEFVEKRE